MIDSPDIAHGLVPHPGEVVPLKSPALESQPSALDALQQIPGITPEAIQGLREMEESQAQQAYAEISRAKQDALQGTAPDLSVPQMMDIPQPVSMDAPVPVLSVSDMTPQKKGKEGTGDAPKLIINLLKNIVQAPGKVISFVGRKFVQWWTNAPTVKTPLGPPLTA